MAWIELHTNLPRHPKLMQLRERLRVKTPGLLGHLCLLWTWTLENAPDGNLARLDAKSLAAVCQFPPRRAEEFLDALLACGFLDGEGQSLRVHDWELYGGRYAHMQRMNRERKRRQRSRETSVTVTPLPDQTPPDQTPPEQTPPDRTETGSISAGAAAGGEAPGREEAFFHSQGLPAQAYAQAAPEQKQAAEGLTEELFACFCAREPNYYDRLRIFGCLSGGGEDPAERQRRSDLLRYAFAQAAQAGRGGNWPYIQGVLGKLERRGIRSLEQAEDYDWERAGLSPPAGEEARPWSDRN